MLEIKSIFKLLRHVILSVMVAGLVWLTGLPTASVQAGPAAYTASKAENIDPSVQAPLQSADDYIESGKKAAEVIPKDLGTGSRQKRPGEMLKRAGEELGNDQVQRAFGAKDYERSPLEQELARNKAARGDEE